MIVSIISILKLIFLTSKSLKSLIDSHNFINLHLKNSLNFNLILHCDLLDFYLTDFPNLTTRIELSFPLKTFCYSGIIIGSCNGLLCIWNSASSGPREIAFWNPCIRKHLILPRPPLFKIKGFRTNNHGFGFDPFARDYKYVLIACFIYPKFRTFHSAVNLFSLESNSWKELPSIPYILCSREHAVGFLVPNSIHWVVNPKVVTVLHEWKYQPRLILAFNLTSEIFNEVPLPEIVNNGINSQGSLEIDVAGLGECLCMTVKDQTTKVDIWMMKEYGSRDSWCKLFTLVELYFNLPTLLRPLRYSSDRSEVLWVASRKFEFSGRLKKLFWYNLKTEEITYVPGMRILTEVMVCAESLVPPSLPKCISKRRY